MTIGFKTQKMMGIDESEGRDAENVGSLLGKKLSLILSIFLSILNKLANHRKYK